ncbi:hypothetical protein T265_04136 [Opisthorchis viverrini]|uniref:Uncharacterized protein n=1 Tax=Opisthorchis viverrini TaxID=6198 RepID=A0A075A127_OPIVI|nr:hypothetical protein T265_04136 [Opisthorchis viverrini]KER29205.1 hypothetical protein T265_04136 [Opisthorchis viverrini]
MMQNWVTFGWPTLGSLLVSNGLPEEMELIRVGDGKAGQSSTPSKAICHVSRVPADSSPVDLSRGYIICYCDTVECQAAGMHECKAEFYCYTVFKISSTVNEGSRIGDDSPAAVATHELTQTVAGRGCVTNDYMDMCARPPYRTHSNPAMLMTKCCRDAWCNADKRDPIVFPSQNSNQLPEPKTQSKIPVWSNPLNVHFTGPVQQPFSVRAQNNQDPSLELTRMVPEKHQKTVGQSDLTPELKRSSKQPVQDKDRTNSQVEVGDPTDTGSLVKLFVQKPVLFTFGMTLAVMLLVFSILLASVLTYRQRLGIRDRKCGLVTESYASLPHVYVNRANHMGVTAKGSKSEVMEPDLWTTRYTPLCCCCREKLPNAYEFGDGLLNATCERSAKLDGKIDHQLTAKGHGYRFSHAGVIVNQIPAIQQTSMWVKDQQQLNSKTPNTSFNCNLDRSSSGQLDDTRYSPHTSNPRQSNSTAPFNTSWHMESEQNGGVEERGSTGVSRPSVGTESSDNTKPESLYVNECSLQIMKMRGQTTQSLTATNSVEGTTTTTLGSHRVHDMPEVLRQRGTGTTSSVGEESRNGMEFEQVIKRETEQSGPRTSCLSVGKQIAVQPFVGLANFRRAEEPQEELVTPYAEVELSLNYI